MARITLSGAPSMRSERLTKIWPSRRRLVVFRDVKRRKRTVMEGIGARGRNARYSCSKIGMRSRVTKFEISTFKSKGRETEQGVKTKKALKHLREARKAHCGLGSARSWPRSSLCVSK